MKKYRKQTLTILFPPLCVGCEKEGSLICNMCHKQLKAYTDECPSCHRISKCGYTCIDCKSNCLFEALLVCFSYTPLIKKMIKEFKYDHSFSHAEFIAKKLALLIQTSQIDLTNSIITYVPMHRWKKKMIRGFNQSELLAQNLAKILGVPVLCVFKKNKWTFSQTRFNKIKRLKNIQGSFSIHDQITQSLIGKHLLIVDDITTTGATLHELTSLIKQKTRNIKVTGVVIARHR